MPPNVHIVPSSDFPSDVLKWMKANSNPKMALKLMKCHKYFQHFPEFPYFVVKDISGLMKLSFRFLDGQECDFEGIENVLKLTKSIWITESLNISGSRSHLSSFIPKIAVCDIKELTLDRQNLSFEEFKYLTASGNIDDLFLRSTKITFQNGDLVFIDFILKCVPNITTFHHMNAELLAFSPKFLNTFKEINISKLNIFSLEMNSYSNFEIFQKFMDKNPHANYNIYFVEDSLSRKETQKVETYIQRIIDSGVTEHPPPFIGFPEQTVEQRDALKLLMRQYKKIYQNK